MKQSHAKNILIVGILGALVGSCAPRNKPKDSTSDLRYIEFSRGMVGLTAQVKKEEIRICLKGTFSDAARAEWEEKISKAVIPWIDALRSVSSSQLTQRVTVVGASENCEAIVDVLPNRWPVTFPGPKPLVRMGAIGYGASVTVMMHEFGHAFGLADTYVIDPSTNRGQAGNCIPGQPQALMCNTKFTTLQADDIAGVQAVFKKVFPNEGSSNPNTQPSNPPSSLPNTTDLVASRLKISLGEAKEDGADLRFAYEEKSISDVVGKMEYCLDTEKKCKAGGIWTSSEMTSDSNNTMKIFKSKDLVPLKDGSSITFRYTHLSGSISRAVKIKKL